MKTQGYAVCMRNGGFGASLEVRKLYPVLNDPEAEANGPIRVIDESGEDYVYPPRLFQRLTLPAKYTEPFQPASPAVSTARFLDGIRIGALPR
jgi:hypothetical protein